MLRAGREKPVSLFVLHLRIPNREKLVGSMSEVEAIQRVRKPVAQPSRKHSE